jgi:hypothetical protein
MLLSVMLSSPKWTAVTLCCSLTLACADGPAEPPTIPLPTIPLPTIPLTLSFCASSPPKWVAVKNASGPWTALTPNAQGEVAFVASERLTVAIVIDAFGATSTWILNVTASEVAKFDRAFACAPATDTATVRGSVNGLVPRQEALITAAEAQIYAFTAFPNWWISGVPASPLDVIATRWPSSSAQAPDRIIVRRRVVERGTEIPAIDFGSAEAHPLQAATVTLSIAQPENVGLVTEVRTATGTTHTLGRHYGDLASLTYLSIPAALREPTDRHRLTATTFGTGGRRRIRRDYVTPTDVSLTFGPHVNPATTSSAGTSPLRLRLQLSSQPEYPTAVSFHYSEADGEFTSRFVSVVTTAAHLGGTPDRWDLSVPDLSEAGYEAEWGVPDGPYELGYAAFAGDLALAFGGSVTDGATLVSGEGGASPVFADRIAVSARSATPRWAAPRVRS